MAVIEPGINAWHPDQIARAARKAQTSIAARAGFMDGARWAIAQAPTLEQYAMALQGCQAGVRFQSERAERAEQEIEQLKQEIARLKAQQ